MLAELNNNAIIKIKLTTLFWGDIYIMLFTNNIYHCFKYYISHIFFHSWNKYIALKKASKQKGSDISLWVGYIWCRNTHKQTKRNKEKTFAKILQLHYCLYSLFITNQKLEMVGTFSISFPLDKTFNLNQTPSTLKSIVWLCLWIYVRLFCFKFEG